jgi:hypothetical protein
MPAAEAPDNMRKRRGVAGGCLFTARRINAAPRKKRAAPEMAIKTLAMASLAAGMRNTQATATKHPTKTQNTTQVSLAFTVSAFYRSPQLLSITLCTVGAVQAFHRAIWKVGRSDMPFFPIVYLFTGALARKYLGTRLV